MNRFVYILFFLLFSLPLSAQTDYLDPVRSLSNYKGELGEYYRNVIWLLNTGFQEKPYARYVVLPSFSPEYALSVEKRNGRCVLVSNTLSRTYWQADKKDVKLDTQSVVISRALYHSLGSLFRLATSQVQDLDGSGDGFDGVVYYFFSTDEKGRLLKGRKWSPANGTLMNQLVQVSQSAYLLSRGSNISEDALCEEAKSLLKKLHQRSKQAPEVYRKPVYVGAYRLGAYWHTSEGVKVDEPAYFPHGEVDTYIAGQLVYPAELKAKNKSGYVLCDFVIDKEGKVQRPVILKATHPLFGEEALRVIKRMPAWQPALIKGKPVESRYSLYIPFRPR